MRSARRSDRKSKAAAAKAVRANQAKAATRAAGKASRNSKSPPAGGLLCWFRSRSPLANDFLAGPVAERVLDAGLLAGCGRALLDDDRAGGVRAARRAADDRAGAGADHRPDRPADDRARDRARGGSRRRAGVRRAGDLGKGEQGRHGGQTDDARTHGVAPCKGCLVSARKRERGAAVPLAGRPRAAMNKGQATAPFYLTNPEPSALRRLMPGFGPTPFRTNSALCGTREPMARTR